MMKTHPRDPRLPDATTQRVGRDRPRAHSASTLRAQMTGFFLAPAAFFAHLQLAYMLVPWSCASGNHLWLHVVGVLSVLVALAGTALAWMVWQREGRGEPGDHGGPFPRARFIAVTALGMSAVFSLLLFWQWIAAFFLSPCA
jgi:hypothetical protein